jgi:hypothetical protein
VKISDLRLDYSFNPYGVLGNSHRITLAAAFGPPIASPDGKTADGGVKDAVAVSKNPTAPRYDVELPRPAPPPAAVDVSVPDSEFSSSPVIFNPGIVSATGVTGSIVSVPALDGVKSFSAAVASRGVFADASLRAAVRHAPDGSSSKYYFRLDAPARVSDAAVIIETARKIKSARALNPPANGGASVPTELTVSESSSNAGISAPEIFVYEIKSDALVDFETVYE